MGRTTAKIIIVEQSSSSVSKEDLNKARSKGLRAMKMKCFLFPQSGSMLFVLVFKTPITLTETYIHIHTVVYIFINIYPQFIQAYNCCTGPACRLGLCYADVSWVCQNEILHLTVLILPQKVPTKDILSTIMLFFLWKSYFRAMLF